MDRWLSVVRGLLQNLGIEPEDGDETGIVTLYVDGDLPIFLLPGDAGATLVLHAGIGAIPDSCAQDVLTILLEGNTVEMARNGFAFGLVPGNDQAIFAGRVSLDGIDDEMAFALLEHFVNTASGWREIFDSLVAKAEDDVSDSAVANEELAEDDRAASGQPRFEDFA